MSHLHVLDNFSRPTPEATTEAYRVDDTAEAIIRSDKNHTQSAPASLADGNLAWSSDGDPGADALGCRWRRFVAVVRRWSRNAVLGNEVRVYELGDDGVFQAHHLLLWKKRVFWAIYRFLYICISYNTISLTVLYRCFSYTRRVRRRNHYGSSRVRRVSLDEEPFAQLPL